MEHQEVKADKRGPFSRSEMSLARSGLTTTLA